MDLENFNSDLASSDRSEKQPATILLLPTWHKPEISRLAIAQTSRVRPRIHLKDHAFSHDDGLPSSDS